MVIHTYIFQPLDALLMHKVIEKSFFYLIDYQMKEDVYCISIKNIYRTNIRIAAKKTQTRVEWGYLNYKIWLRKLYSSNLHSIE